MDRRDFILSSATLAAFTLTGRAEAADTKKHHAGHQAATARDPALEELAEEASECIEKLEACIPYCITFFQDGDPSLAECLATALRLRPVVSAMSSVVAFDGKPTDSTRALAAACAKFCRECEQACEPHYEMHAVCRECGKTCADCARRCDAVAGAA